MNYTKFKKKVIQAAKNAAITDYELYYSNSDTTSIETFKEEVTHFTSSNNTGVNFRCIVKNKIGNASSELFTKEAAISLVQHAVENASSIESEDIISLFDTKSCYQQTNAKIFKPASSNQLIETAVDCQKKLFQSDCRVAEATQTFTKSGKHIVQLCNSKGLDLKHEYTYDLVYISAVVHDADIMYQVKLIK